MVDTLLYVQIGILVVVVFSGIALAFRYLFRDSFRSFNGLGEPLGKFELNEILGRSKTQRRSRRNIIELTQTMLDHGAGKTLKEALVRGLSDPTQQIGLDKDQIASEKDKIEEMDTETLFISEDLRLRVFGIGGLGSNAEIYVTVLSPYADLRMLGHPSFSRGGNASDRTVLYGRKIQLPKKYDFGGLGIRKVSFFDPFPIDPLSGDEEEQKKRTAAIDKITEQILPFLGGINQMRSMALEIKHLETMVHDLKKERASKDLAHAQALASAISGQGLSSSLASLLHLKTASGARATWMMLIMMISGTAGAAIAQNILNTNAILGVLVGLFIGAFISSATRGG